jgi:hypothetical protein
LILFLAAAGIKEENPDCPETSDAVMFYATSIEKDHP